MSTIHHDPMQRVVQEVLGGSNPPSIEQLVRERHTDQLTGLPNRDWLDRCLPQMLEEYPGEVALLALDLDGFKEINDTQGHPAGDQHLQEVATNLRTSTEDRPGDVVVRLSGDEFFIVLLGIHTQEDLLAVTGRVQTALDAVGNGGSVGSVRHDGENAQALRHRADQSMLAVKKKKKLEKATPEQRAACQDIGALATRAGLNLRDVPLLLVALEEEGEQPSEELE